MRQFLIFFLFFLLIDNITLLSHSFSVYIKPDTIYNGSIVLFNFENLDKKNKYELHIKAYKDYSYPIYNIKKFTTILVGIPLLSPDTVEVTLLENKSVIYEDKLKILKRYQQVSYLKVKKKYALRRINKKLYKRLEKEYNILQKAKKNYTLNRFFWGKPFFPIKGGKISSPFGAIRYFNKKKKKSIHWGIDIAAKVGTPIYSVFDGKVILIGNFYYAGKSVIIDSGEGLIIFYEHLNKVYVQKGNFVKKGEIIGEVGKTGRVTGPHLHLGVYVNNICVDPLSLFSILK